MILGIDLGTSNSMAAVYKDGEVHLIKSRTGNYLIPSVVSMDEKGVFYCGDLAKERKLKHPFNTVDMFKRSMGTDKMYQIGDKEMKAEELSAIILRSIKEDAEYFLGEKITDAVISVPAFFNNPQREAVINAGTLAGFNVRKIINEPTAAAMAYGMENMDENREKAIIVLDLGGGTFDISVMEITDDVMEVVAICGDNKLGGGDFTQRLADLFIKANRIEDELTPDDKAMLWNQAQRAKHSITENGVGIMKCTINNVEYTYSITEDEYAEECFDLLEKIRKLTIRAIDESEYTNEEIEEIIMVGGGTRLSIVNKMMEKMSGRKLSYQINPDEAVVRGAALQGALMEHNKDVKNLIMTDICPYHIGIEVAEWKGDDPVSVFKPYIRKNTVIPAKYTHKSTVYPSKQALALYQSGDEYGTDKIEIGKCEYIVPETENEGCQVIQTMIYDNNGIMSFETYIPEVEKTYGTIISSTGISMEEAKKRLEEFKYFNISSRDDEEDLLLIARAENIYAETLGHDREIIGNAITEFETALNTHKKNTIAQARNNIISIIEQIYG